jgi:uncharacterized protein YggE
MVNNLINVKIRDVGKAGIVIDEAVKAGGDLTRVNNISFTVNDPLPYYDQAREKAMADAKDRAQALAELAGVKLGRPSYITESVGQATPPVALGIKSSADMAQTTPISAGQLEIDITVQAVYTIR